MAFSNLDISKINKKITDAVDVTVLDVDGVVTLVITDCENNSLKSFYVRGQQTHQSFLQLDTIPWSVTRLTHNQVAVSYGDQTEITTVEVTPDLVLLSNMTTEKMYTGLTALNATTIVAGCRDPPSLDILDILDMEGHVLSSITTSRKLIQTPDFLSTTNEGNILVSDGGLNSVLSLTPEGDLNFNYKPSEDRAMRWPRGVTTSTTGDILVADNFNNKVVQLTPTGTFVRELLTSQDDMDTPYGICLHEDKLYVVEGSGHLKMYDVTL